MAAIFLHFTQKKVKRERGRVCMCVAQVKLRGLNCERIILSQGLQHGYDGWTL